MPQHGLSLKRPVFRWGCAATVFCFGFLSAARSSAASIDTLSSFSGRSIDSFGELAGSNPGAVTFGETFVIHGTDATAQNLSFMVRPYYPVTAPQQCTFQACLMAWNGSRPNGAVLFASSPLTTTGSAFNWQIFSVPLADTLLRRDQPYVAFFTADNFLDGIRSDAAMAANDNVYADGTFVAHYNEFSFNDLLVSDWSAPFGNLFDLAIHLDYQPVPEPAMSVLLASALAGVVAGRRLRRPA